MNTMRAIVALRMARAAIGLSQQEVADLLGIAKTTLARFETNEGGLNASQLAGLIRLFHDNGITLEFITSNDVMVRVNEGGVEKALSRLQDEAMRRSDRRKPRGLLDPVAHPGAEDSPNEITKPIKGLLDEQG